MAAMSRPVRYEVTVTVGDQVNDRRAWLGLGLASSSWMVVSLTVTSVNVAFPEIERDLAGASRSILGWGITGYSIALAALMLLGGRLADHLGRRRVFRTGLAVFLLASLALAAAPGPWWFVAGRLGQAAGAALCGPSSLSLVIELFPVARRARAISTWAALGTLGSAIGPTFAALVTEWLSWRMVFVLPLVATVTALALAGRFLPEGRGAVPSHTRRIDVLSSVIGSAGVGLLAAVIIEAPKLGWSDPLVVGAAVTVVILLPVFVVRCLRHDEPLLDVRLFALPNVAAVNIVNVAMAAAGTAVWLMYPLLMVQRWDYSLLRTGLALTPFPLMASGSGVIAARIAERVGTRRVIAYGAVLPAAGLGLQAWLISDRPNYVVGVLLGGLMFNLGFGIVYSPITALGLRSVTADKMGQATAAFNALRQLGGGLGVAMVIAILGDAEVVGMESFRGGLWASAVIALVATLTVFTALRVPAEFRRR